MTFDSLLIAAILSEIKEKTISGVVQKVRQKDNDEVVLEIRVPGFTYSLLFCISPKFARLHLTNSKIKTSQTAPDFCMILRKYLTGSYLIKCEQIGFDRIIKFTFLDKENIEFHLICEIMGKHSNLIFIDSEDKILGCLKPVGTSISKVRQVLIGRDYILPPNVERINPLEASFELYKSVIEEITETTKEKQIKEVISKFSGISPFLANEIFYNIDVKDEKAYENLERIKNIYNTNSFVANLIVDEEGFASGVYPIFLNSIPKEHQLIKESINETIDTTFRSIINRSIFIETKNNLLAAINNALTYKKLTVKSCNTTIDKALTAEHQKEIGDLIIASSHTIKKGAKSIDLINYYDPNMSTITVELDNKITPIENAEKYFKRYKRLKEAARLAEERLIFLWDEIEKLEIEKEKAENEQKTTVLRDTHKELIKTNLLRTEQTEKENNKSEFAGYKIRHLYSPEGWEIFYGESSSANDYLTTKLARTNDIWLHARQITGAHVIIRTTAKTAANVPFNVILFAAKIAARNSEAKHSGIVPVDYTFKKHVRKPRGSAQGFVIYKLEKTIDVDMNN